jgi:hypothetical protein
VALQQQKADFAETLAALNEKNDGLELTLREPVSAVTAKVRLCCTHPFRRFSTVDSAVLDKLLLLCSTRVQTGMSDAVACQVSMLEDMAKRSAARVSAVATDAEQAQLSDWMLGLVWGKARDAVGICRINLWSAFCSLSRTWRHESGMALPFFVRNTTACDVLRLPIWL